MSWLANRWLLGAVGWAALSAAIWFVGDALSFGGWRPLEGPLERLALIVAIGTGWLGWELVRTRKSLRENEQLLEGIAGADQDSAARAAHEVALLRKRMQDAALQLRKARFRGAGGERRTVADLPWYMFIGAPGSGKTTALLNAGLRFPLGMPGGERALHGIGGTRNCDWWFTDEAVLLDTAGRYTTQESDPEADAAAWLGFLDLVKRHRPRQPLNGVIVTVSLTDLLHWSREEMARYAEHVRGRIRELTARLRVRLPVYVLVTKTDLLAGFMEFFGELDADGRAQVWGMTFEHSQVCADPGARFEEEFAHLERRLYGMLAQRLQEERDLQRRAAIYRFPQQFRATGPLMRAFMESAFGGSGSGEGVLLRGVYFASGTQEGSPIDRVLATLARSFNLERKVQPPHLGGGKSFFLRRLLRDVLLGEAGLGGVDPAAERVRRRRQLAACAAMVVFTFALAALWSASYFSNRELVAATAQRSEAAAAAVEKLHGLRPGEEERLISALNLLRELQAERDGNPVLHAGLYQGEKLGAQGERVYRNVLRESLLARIAVSLEGALRTGATPELLDGYLALHGAGDVQRIEQAALRLWPLPAAARADLAVHLRAALAERPLTLPRARDDALIEQARRKLGVRA